MANHNKQLMIDIKTLKKIKGFFCFWQSFPEICCIRCTIYFSGNFLLEAPDDDKKIAFDKEKSSPDKKVGPVLFMTIDDYFDAIFEHLNH